MLRFLDYLRHRARLAGAFAVLMLAASIAFAAPFWDQTRMGVATLYTKSIEFFDSTDTYKTTLSFPSAGADREVTIPDFGATAALMPSTLTTNAPDVANSVWGVSNGLRFEGAVANASEGTLSPGSMAADVTWTLPPTTGAVAISQLTTNDVDVANSVWGASNSWVFEGATANAFESSITPTDPTADRTLTLPDASGTVALLFAQGADEVANGETSKATTIAGIADASHRVIVTPTEIASNANYIRAAVITANTLTVTVNTDPGESGQSYNYVVFVK